MTGSKKAIGDINKPRISLLPYELVWETAKAMSYGAKKYSTWNYREGIDVLFLIDAAQRHIIQFVNGEDVDEESQTHHLGNAASNLGMALWMCYNKPERDNRWRKNGNQSKKTRRKRLASNKRTKKR